MDVQPKGATTAEVVPEAEVQRNPLVTAAIGLPMGSGVVIVPTTTLPSALMAAADEVVPERSAIRSQPKSAAIAGVDRADVDSKASRRPTDAGDKEVMKQIFRKGLIRCTAAAVSGCYAKELCELRLLNNSKGCRHFFDCLRCKRGATGSECAR